MWNFLPEVLLETTLAIVNFHMRNMFAKLVRKFLPILGAWELLLVIFTTIP